MYASIRLGSKATLSATAAATARRSKHTLPDLPYDYNALEPVISAEIMQLHHAKHHNAYVTNLNVAEEKYGEAQAGGNATAGAAQLSALKFNGGGHINHSIFWQNLCATRDYTDPQGELLGAIKAQYGSLDALKTQMSAAAAGVQGSGWAWLGYDAKGKCLQVATTANQDPLHATLGLAPLLGIDVWEHAYYLQYKNVRPDYLKAIWGVVNWKDVAARYGAAAK